MYILGLIALTQNRQMKTNKYILFLGLMLLVSASLFGQAGRKKIILSTGDTVLVVKQQSFLTPEDIKFLRKDTLKSGAIMDMKSDYNSLEAAALDVDKLLAEIGVSQSLSKQNNESLSVRLATRNLRNLKKEQQARNTWDSIMAKEPTVKELTEFYELYGNKPSYFINGVMVDEQLVNRLRSSEILSRQLRTIDTATGNPNGEIWYEVTEPALRRLGFSEVKNNKEASEIRVIKIDTSVEPDTPASVERPKPPVDKKAETQEVQTKPTPRFKVIKKEDGQ